MSNYSEYYDAINEIISHLKTDLIGPVSIDEILTNIKPLDYYGMGILWPKGIKESEHSLLRLDSQDELQFETDDENTIKIPSDDFDELEDETQDANDSIKNANKYKPSSMAITVMVLNTTKTLEVKFEYAKYIHSINERKMNDKTYIDHLYKRQPYSTIKIISIPNKCCQELIALDDDAHSNNFQLSLHVRKMFKTTKLITIAISNHTEAQQKIILQNEKSLFQCHLELSLLDGFQPLYDPIENTNYDNETLINNILYRDVNNYAYGHGCSVNVLEINNKIQSIHSEFIPSQQVCQMMPGNIQTDIILKNKYWASIDRQEGCNQLKKFVLEYLDWFTNIRKQSLAVADNDVHNLIMEKIEECIKRLNSGIETLLNNDKAWEAFILMHEAMLLQRKNTKKINDDEIAWYPFQIAYIIQIIPDIVDKNSEYRNVVDLLWFPTGGGKTEAYLGVSAFCIFYRRLSENIGINGVTVIMRYTLRLLTIQQFERSMALICACEYLRKKYKGRIPGDEISIGLWIGKGMTPNKLNGEGGASEVLFRLFENPNAKIIEGNPIQVTVCPWCGSKIGLEGYPKVDRKQELKSLTIHCPNEICEFHEKLPIYLVDEEIYLKKPTLILSTIDKFARITWEPNSDSLFGIGDLPPGLIIQDELHLISGPLGSLAGIYEIAVDELCKKNAICGSSPKIIASTATAKNAPIQIKNLYNKRTFQFPPNGITINDSFFAKTANTSERPARTYLGLCEPGGSMADLIIRVYAVFFYMRELFKRQNKDTQIIDQFFTVIGYFNTIKNLGASTSIIQDRVDAYMKSLYAIKFREETSRYNMTYKSINFDKHDELTSRKSSKEIKDILSRLDVTYSNKDCYSYVLASNMLSVGIDINRLGLMTIYNQPKTNSEYIQATSRVGRKYPGLVTVLFNNMRTRDKSYYEQFNYYHKVFYKYVESTSVTPFSSRAIEKALHCVFIALIRLRVNALRDNNSARDFHKLFEKNKEIILSLKQDIVNRVKSINPFAQHKANEYLDNIIEAWDDISMHYSDTLVYYDYHKRNISLLDSERFENSVQFPAILNSVRNVENESNIYIKTR
jgi:hypothetical protein